ncbi:MAG: WS/DGAT domain-containing protein, partial [Rhizobacter sp.]
VDGKAGIEIAKVFYDLTPQPREVRPPRPARASNPYQLGVAELLQAAISNSVAQYAKLGKMLPQTVKAIGRTTVRFISARRQAPRERSLGLKMAPKTIFNASITNQRSFGSLSVPLGELKTLGKQMGGTLNDVVMAMCSGALRTFLRERDLLPAKSLIALVPVSLREADDSSNNNQVSAIRVDLATDLADPAQRFQAIRESSDASKELIGGLKPMLGADLPIAGSPWLMSGMASLYGRSNLGARLPRFGNVAISNVPGPAVPLYMAGARMAHYVPVSIPYHGVGLNITVQSYAGEMEFGITACRRVLSQPEVHELKEHLMASLRELQRLAPVAVQETTLPAPPRVARSAAQRRHRRPEMHV